MIPGPPEPLGRPWLYGMLGAVGAALLVSVRDDWAVRPGRGLWWHLGAGAIALAGGVLLSAGYRRRRRDALALLDHRAKLLDNMQDAVVSLDAGLQVTDWNHAAEQLFGWSRAEAVGRRFEDLVETVYPDGATILDIQARVRRAGRVKIEARRRTQRGEWLETETAIASFGGVAGRPAGLVSVMRDVSLRRRAEMALRASQERVQRILETSNDGIWLVDAHGRTEFVNARAAEMLDVSGDEVLGRALPEVLPESLRGAGRDAVEALGRGESLQREVRLRRRDGSDGWLVLSGSSLRDAEGHITGGVLVFLDVTEYRRAMEELQQAQKLEAIGRLAAGIAHEINTPIQYIGDNSRFVEEAFGAVAGLLALHREVAAQDLPDARRRELDAAAEAADLDYVLEQAPLATARNLEGVRRVATIVRAMKEFAHPDQDQPVECDINSALLATLEVARGEYKHVADVETELGALPPVKCRPGELNQVFLNVVINAAHAIGDVVATSGRGTIRVRSSHEPPEVVVAISDTGPGIPEEIRAKIFDPFFTTKEVGNGTGQGLWLARRIVAQHRGQITFTTTPGQGTTFFVRLPVDADEVTEP